MPYDHYSKAIASLVTPAMFGPTTGAAYQAKLQAAFDASGNKAQIDQALSLGNHRTLTQAEKDRRAATRAVLAAYFLIDHRPLGEKSILENNLKNMDIHSLKRAFSARFPALQDNGNRPSWAPGTMTNPATLNAYFKPVKPGKPVPALPFQFIIHGVANWQGQVLEDAEILSKYEVLSMSLMSHLVTHAHDPQGVILSVPANNILAASTTDVAVQNYAPAFDPKTPNALTITENLMDIAIRMGGLKTPGHLNANPRGYPYYNEVVVCGRSGVPLPHGQTGQIRVVGCYILTDKNGVIRGDVTNAQQRVDRVERFAASAGLRVLYLPNDMSRPAM